MELDVMYEDEDVLVVNKPAGLVVHPGNGNYTGTLVHGVAWHLLQQQNHLPPDLSNGRPVDAQFNEVIPRPGLVHRLDKDTTGVMVLGKTEQAMTSLSQQFFERSVDRRYLALVWGDLEEDGTIEGHIGRNRRNRKIQAVFPHGDEGKHATTHYTVLERLGPVTLLECKLETGRTHQIRVHMEHLRASAIRRRFIWRQSRRQRCQRRQIPGVSQQLFRGTASAVASCEIIGFHTPDESRAVGF